MKYRRSIFIGLFWVLLGIALNICYYTGLIQDSFWSSMGFSVLAVGLLQLIRKIRYCNSEDYREKFDTESNDERNRFLSNKAWAWTGYFFVLIASCGTLVFKFLDREDLMLLCSGAVCLMVLLYWLSYMILKKKY